MLSPMTQRPVVNERDTAAYKVFKWPFEVLIPSSYALTEYEISQMGTVTTGDRKIDAELANELAHSYRTIAQLAKLHSEGCPIQLVNPRKDAVRIYDLVQAYLMEWANDISSGFSVEVESPEYQEKMRLVLKDIELLEQFSETVYPMAKRTTPAAMRVSSLANKLAQLSNIKLRYNPPPVQQPELPKTAPSPFTDNLTNAAQDRIRRWASSE